MDKANIYISHAWGGESEKVVQQIFHHFQEAGLNIALDKKDLGYRQSITNFMLALGKADAIIVVVSNKYLRSEYCMFELLQIYENKDIHSRIFPIVLDDVDIAKSVNRVELVKYWEVQTAELESKIRELTSLSNIEGLSDDLNLYQNIRSKIARLTHILKDINTLNIKLHSERDFRDLVEAVQNRLDTVKSQDNIQAPVEVQNPPFHKRTPPVTTRAQSSGPSKFGRLADGNVKWFIAFGLLLVMILIFLLRTCASEKPGMSFMGLDAITIAVMPFEFLGADVSKAYYADGVSEDILNSISKISKFNVLARAAVLPYRDSKSPLSEVARQLNAHVFLTGSVMPMGNRIKVTTSLIDPNTMHQIWSEQYDRNIEDLYSVQAEVAMQVARALLSNYLENASGINESDAGPGFDIYDLYLRGRHLFLNYNELDNAQAIAIFRNALVIDSLYGAAWAGLAEAYAQRIKYGHDWDKLDSIKICAKRAIQINPKLPEAHKALGNYYHIDRKLSEAILSYEKAIELNPNYYAAILNIALCYIDMDQLDKSLLNSRKILILNPEDTKLATSLQARVFSGLGCDSLADVYFNRLYTADSTYFALYYYQIVHCQYRKDKVCAGNVIAKLRNFGQSNYQQQSAEIIYNVMIEDYERAYTFLGALDPDDPLEDINFRRLFILNWLGFRSEAMHLAMLYKDWFEDLVAENDFVSDVAVLQIMHTYAFLGERAKFIEWVDIGINRGVLNYRYLETSPYLATYRNNSEFKKSLFRARSIRNDMILNLEESITGFRCR